MNKWKSIKKKQQHGKCLSIPGIRNQTPKLVNQFNSLPKINLKVLLLFFFCFSFELDLEKRRKTLSNRSSYFMKIVLNFHCCQILFESSRFCLQIFYYNVWNVFAGFYYVLWQFLEIYAIIYGGFSLFILSEIWNY